MSAAPVPQQTNATPRYETISGVVERLTYYSGESRNLFYTGLTRAKRLAIVVGSKKAISLALRSTEKQQRYTQLAKKLEQAVLLP